LAATIYFSVTSLLRDRLTAACVVGLRPAKCVRVGLACYEPISRSDKLQNDVHARSAVDLSVRHRHCTYT